jgi:hypothetical protein
MNGQTLFGDSDHFGGFFINAFGSSSFGLVNFGSSKDRPGKGGSQCLSDGSSNAVHRCMEGDLSSLITASPGAGSDAGYEPAHQSSNFSGSNPLFGGVYPSVSQIPGFEMKAAQISFAMTWPWGAIQGTFPPACGDLTPLVVGAPTSDLVDPNEGPDSGPAPIPPGDFLSDPPGTGQGPTSRRFSADSRCLSFFR